MTRRKHPPLLSPVPARVLRTVITVFISALATTAARAQTYMLTTLATFGGTNSGAYPQSNLVFDKQGNVYGATSGDRFGNGEYGAKYGTIFKIDAGTRVLTTIATFDGVNGAAPCGALAIDKNGNLYGTTRESVFKVVQGAKTITTLAKFDPPGFRGWGAEGVTLDRKGDLYGTMPFTQMGPGSLFKIVARTNAFASLAKFDFKPAVPGRTDDNKPTDTASLDGMVCPGVAVDNAGNLYGTVASSNTFPYGFVYEIKAATQSPVVLATFNGLNGRLPNGYVVLDSKGDLYGSTEDGGEHDKGTVFEVKAGARQIVTRASFDGENGSSPLTGVILDRAGNLYGTTSSSTAIAGDAGGARVPVLVSAPQRGGSGTGTVFKIAKGAKTITTLARFVGAPRAFPTAGLTIDSAGNIYGAINKGGPNDNGLVFKLVRAEVSPSPTARL